jgi:hypothetical protein
MKDRFVRLFPVINFGDDDMANDEATQLLNDTKERVADDVFSRISGTKQRNILMDISKQKITAKDAIVRESNPPPSKGAKTLWSSGILRHILRSTTHRSEHLAWGSSGGRVFQWQDKMSSAMILFDI